MENIGFITIPAFLPNKYFTLDLKYRKLFTISKFQNKKSVQYKNKIEVDFVFKKNPLNLDRNVLRVVKKRQYKSIILRRDSY